MSLRSKLNIYERHKDKEIYDFLKVFLNSLITSIKNTENIKISDFPLFHTIKFENERQPKWM